MIGDLYLLPSISIAEEIIHERGQDSFLGRSISRGKYYYIFGKTECIVKEFEHFINKHSRIIEIGCGEGQNVLYLSQQGYINVDAFDLSENGIAKLKKICNKSGTQLNAFVADLTTFDFETTYDLIMSFGTLHFVSKDDWKRFIIKAKDNTNVGGIHIMQIFTDKVPASEDIAPFAIGLAKDGEIKELYDDWEVLQYKSYVFEDEHPNVPKHLHASNKIVASELPHTRESREVVQPLIQQGLENDEIDENIKIYFLATGRGFGNDNE